MNYFTNNELLAKNCGITSLSDIFIHIVIMYVAIIVFFYLKERGVKSFGEIMEKSVSVGVIGLFIYFLLGLCVFCRYESFFA